MALTQTAAGKGEKPIATAATAGSTISVTYEYAITAAIAGAVNDIIEMGALPAFHKPVACTLDVTDLDTNGSPTIALDVGLMSGTFADNDATRTCGDEIFDGVTTAQAGGVNSTVDADMFDITATDANRGIGVKIATAAATGAAGTLRLHVQYARVDV